MISLQLLFSVIFLLPWFISNNKSTQQRGLKADSNQTTKRKIKRTKCIESNVRKTLFGPKIYIKISVIGPDFQVVIRELSSTTTIKCTSRRICERGNKAEVIVKPFSPSAPKRNLLSNGIQLLTKVQDIFDSSNDPIYSQVHPRLELSTRRKIYVNIDIWLLEPKHLFSLFYFMFLCLITR